VVLERAGGHLYEVATWARNPDGYSRHNAIYWQHGDYLGIGAGAFGTLGNRRTMNHLLPETYCAAIDRGESGASNIEEIDPGTAMAETMMLGLRLLDHGVSDTAFARRHGTTLDDAYGPAIEELTTVGLVERTGGGLRLTPRGLLLANDVIARFL
jgi:oxygen-independent coproporphyrinogen-3 oxidase